MMKKIYLLFLATALMGFATAAKAQNAVEGVSVSDVKIERNGKYMAVEMTLDLEDLDVEPKRAVLLTPRLVNGADSLDLTSVGIYGRQRYFYYLRNGEEMISGEDEISYKAKDKPDTIDYSEVVPYESWMNGATLSLHREDYGCCDCQLAEEDSELGSNQGTITPELVYVCPEGETGKTRAIEGSAFIDFPVNKTEIHSDYRHNAVELDKIQATIDSVKNDSDVQITTIGLKGYASPEGSYEHNTELAQGRTEALKQHILWLYNFDDDVITTAYEPEDWEGLRRFVESSNLDDRSDILDLIDSNMDPDEKEAKIRSSYPNEYKFLLESCYPALRHTDYRVSYEVRAYTDIEEIKRLVYERPQHLSLNEFYLAAQEYEPGSEEFTNVFETAVRMYPEDEAANINAANAAMKRGELEIAAHYLDRAGDSAEAVYARGALAILKEEYDTARNYLNEAKDLGLEQAEVTLEQMDQAGL